MRLRNHAAMALPGSIDGWDGGGGGTSSLVFSAIILGGNEY